MRSRMLRAAAALLLTLGLASCGNDDATGGSAASTPATESPTPSGPRTPSATQPAKGTCEYLTDSSAGEAARPVDLPPAKPVVAEGFTIKTSDGDIPVRLDPSSAPCAANSFTSLAMQGYFDNTKCTRVSIADQAGYGILQCGDPSGTQSGGPGYRFDDELTGDETYGAGTLAMANAGTQDGHGTNGSQFFLCYADSAFPPNYSVFGSIDPAGIKVLKEIAADGTTTGDPDGPPAKGVTIESVS